VLCVVYVLRHAGEKLPIDVVKGRPHPGWLHLGNSQKFFPQEALNLFETAKLDKRVCESLIYPTLKKLQRGGMLWLGSQELRSSEYRPQAWWVVPGLLDDTASPPPGL